jgi:hypothetical protein
MLVKHKNFFSWSKYSEWVIVALWQSNFSAISWWEQANFQRDDDEIRFVLDQHA